MPRNHDQMGRHRNGGNGAAFGGAVGPVRPWMDARASLRQHSRPLRRLARYGGIPIVAYCRVHGACTERAGAWCVPTYTVMCR
ncbi:hypothetical protein DM50_3402 [Burkholderia mallei]|nr:hypothetical protein DM45_3400 [Burkholderia mallei]KOT02360.1 hypothetical protein DM50_3402 [Burkholderia mallei]